MPSDAAIAEMRRRQGDLQGSCILFQGQSGTGKSHEATECWLKSAMEYGGAAIAYDPTGDIGKNVRSYELGYIRRIDALDKDKRTVHNGQAREGACKVLDFLRYNVICHPGMDAESAFDTVAGYVGSHNPTGYPRFSFLVDEGSQARKNSGFLESLVPLMRNLHGIAFVTGHRSMAVPPQVRAVLRARVLWRSSDGTGDETLEKEIASIEGFKFSPIMGKTNPEDQFYRGVRYTAEGPVGFEYNPNNGKRPDWMLLPANPTRVAAREFRG